MSNVTPAFAMFKQMQTKAANEAITPGVVGPGPNPGTTGSMDSPIETATNTQLAAQRAMQSAAPILASTDADGGAGTGQTIPTAMPAQHMFTQVQQTANQAAGLTPKAAAIVDYGCRFAEYLRDENKAAYAQEKSASTADEQAFMDKLAGLNVEQGYELGRQFALQNIASGNLAAAQA